MTSFDERAQKWDQNPMRRERADAVAQAIRQHLPNRKDLRALEYGCGTGLLSFALQDDFAHITLADNAKGMLQELERKIHQAGIRHFSPLLLDLISQPPPAESFHVIYTLMTLHHILDLHSILGAFHHLLLPDGFLFIADLDEEDGSFHGSGFQGHLGFDRSVLARYVQEAGFRNITFQTVYVIKRQTEDGENAYPIFLMTARRK